MYVQAARREWKSLSIQKSDGTNGDPSWWLSSREPGLYAVQPGIRLIDERRDPIRLAALQANPDNVIPWEEVEARALARFQK